MKSALLSVVCLFFWAIAGYAHFFDDWGIAPVVSENASGQCTLTWEAADGACKYGPMVDGLVVGPWTDQLSATLDCPVGSTYDFSVRARACSVNHFHLDTSAVSQFTPDGSGGGTGGTGGTGTGTPPNSEALVLANLGSDGEVDTGTNIAFPGALGFGRQVTGGRGGSVVTVTTTADNCTAGDGQVTLREALSSCGDVAAGPRYVTFAVGGLFARTVNDEFAVDSNLTIACQTAPTHVAIAETLQVRNSDNIIIRYCTLRGPGPGGTYLGPQQSRGFNLTDSDGFIADHMSISWYADSQGQGYNGTTNNTLYTDVTVQHSLLGQGDGEQLDTTNGLPHALGLHCLSNRSDGVSSGGCTFAYNVQTNFYSRFGMWGAEGEFINNLAYNWYDNGISMLSSGTIWPPGGGYIINNIVMRGPLRASGGTPYNTGSNSARLVQNSNYFQGSVGAGPSGAPAWGTNYSGTAPFSQLTPAGTDIRVLTANANTDHMRCIGASQWGHDAFDQGEIADIYAGTGPNLTELGTVNPQNFGIYSGASHPASYDTDNDGIADVWEQLVIDLDGADSYSSLADINALTDIDGDGFPAIEEWMNTLARCDHVGGAL